MSFLAADEGLLVVDDYRPLADAISTVAAVVTDVRARIAKPDDALAILDASPSTVLVILNREMKPVTGAALTQAIRARSKFDHVRILMTGTGVDASRARALGADGGIATPFHSAALHEVLSGMMPGAAHRVAAE